MAGRFSNTVSDNLLFKPGIVRGSKKQTAPLRELTLDSIGNDLSLLTGSFRYDTPGTALKSSQQLNLDFSDFSQHTFFNSAEAKTQKVFSKIINRYPFDGTKSDVYAFVDTLTGFEKHVFDLFPSNNGYLQFSGSSSPSSPGTYIEVRDFRGSTSPTLTSAPTGQSVLDPKNKSFTVEFNFIAPEEVNDNQVILQKKSINNGLTLFLSQTSSTSVADLYMLLSSGSTATSVSIPVTKGQFHHFAAVFDRSLGPGGRINFYKDAALAGSSSFTSMGEISFVTASMLLGSGSSHYADGFLATPVETLSGALGDVRFWHKAKTQKEIRVQRYTEIFAQDNLKFLMRLNEPSGSFSGTGQNLALDYSGNGLHSHIQNFSMSLRNTSSFGASPLIDSSRFSSICLFPSYSPVVELNARLLASASQYDFNNPNLVTRLIPPHYLKNASQAEGFSSEFGGISSQILTQDDEPGGAIVGQPQIIAGILYTFAETFDELKMFIDEFKRLLKVDVLSTDTISDHLLPWLSRYYGIQLPPMFDGATAEQFLDGKGIRLDRSRTTALQTVQNTMWRRVFSDLPFLFSTRGTHASIRAILANIGMGVGGPIRVREFGGSPVRNLGDSYIRRHEISAVLDMSGTLSTAGSLNFQGVDDSRPFLQSSFLSGSRVEPGRPLPRGALGSAYAGGPITGSDVASDGLLTSGSWTVEGRYKFRKSLKHNDNQSLARLHTTGSTLPASSHGTLFNCVATKPKPLSSTTGSITLYGRPSESHYSPIDAACSNWR